MMSIISLTFPLAIPVNVGGGPLEGLTCDASNNSVARLPVERSRQRVGLGVARERLEPGVRDVSGLAFLDATINPWHKQQVPGARVDRRNAWEEVIRKC